MQDRVNDSPDPDNNTAPCLSQFCIKKMTQKPDSRNIVVAGASSGIGRALVKLLAAESAAVTAIGRDAQKLKTLREEVPTVRTVSLDARDRPALEDFFRREGEGSIDHLVLTLGGSKGGGAFRSLSLADLREGFDNKFWPQLEVLQAGLPSMRANGSITLITAMSATAVMPGTAGLGAINGALEIMVPILAKELKPLRVNAVSPGLIDTPWWDFVPAAARQQVFTDFSAQIGVGRVGRPEEVAATVRFVLETEYINGVIIGCHGGILSPGL
jgi:NAD(P)-dependent dehydrogenase (short-subunit alcohol dehydrogenase family)